MFRLLALAFAVGTSVLAVPAAAAPPTGPVTSSVPGLQTVNATSAFDSSTTKFVTASCPAGTVTVGSAARTGGIFGDPSNNQVLLEGVVPVTNAVLAQASEDEDGYAGNWSLTATAICASPPPGLFRFTNSTGMDSAAFKGKAGTCPTGTKLIGTGAAVISASTGQVRLSTISALTLLSGPNAVAAEDATGFSGTWALQVHGICASPLAGNQLVEATTSTASPSRALTSATCPSGKRATGVGAYVTIPTASLGRVGLDSLIPSPVSGAPTGHVAAASEDQLGTAANWSLTTQAICATA